MKKASAILLLSVLGVCTYSLSAQLNSQFDAAAEAYESGEYEQTISLLAAYEKTRGTSPRLESLRALAYRELDKPKEAHQAVLVYLRLTARRDMSGSEAHQDMLKLRDEMLEAIEKKHKDDKEKLDKERDEEAKNVVEQLEAMYRSPEIRTGSSSALPASIKAKLDYDSPGEYIGPSESAPKTGAVGTDALAELEMWRKISQSTVAMDYFLFIESFPNGKFTEIARKKMHEIGDPIWNEVRKSFDPFKYRDYIKANTDSPFVDLAKVRMDYLAKVAIEWEQIRVGDLDSQRAFETRNAGHPLAAVSKKAREDFTWRNIENVTNPALFRDFLANFPDSSRAPEARAKLDALIAPKSDSPAVPVTSAQAVASPRAEPNFKLNAMHQHGMGMSWAQGEVSFDGVRLKFVERVVPGMSKPEAGHAFSYLCSDLKRLKYVDYNLLVETRSGDKIMLVLALEKGRDRGMVRDSIQNIAAVCGF